jgi:hypothetical protein
MIERVRVQSADRVEIWLMRSMMIVHRHAFRDLPANGMVTAVDLRVLLTNPASSLIRSVVRTEPANASGVSVRRVRRVLFRVYTPNDAHLPFRPMP